MSADFNRPLYNLNGDGSADEPSVGDEFEWRGERLQCVVTETVCHGCRFNWDHRRTVEHRREAAEGCAQYFCEPEKRRDKKQVKFVKAKQKEATNE